MLANSDESEDNDEVSFFHFFTSKSSKDEDEEAKMDVAADYEIAEEIRNDLLALALEYYLDIVDMKLKDDEEEDEED